MKTRKPISAIPLHGVIEHGDRVGIVSERFAPQSDDAYTVVTFPPNQHVTFMWGCEDKAGTTGNPLVVYCGQGELRVAYSIDWTPNHQPAKIS